MSVLLSLEVRRADFIELGAAPSWSLTSCRQELEYSSSTGPACTGWQLRVEALTGYRARLMQWKPMKPESNYIVH